VFDILVNRGTPGDILLPLAIFLIFGAIFPLCFHIIGLDTQIKNDGLYIRFKPFHFSWVIFKFDEIKTADAVTYSPIKEYGGWGRSDTDEREKHTTLVVTRV